MIFKGCFSSKQNPWEKNLKTKFDLIFVGLMIQYMFQRFLFYCVYA